MQYAVRSALGKGLLWACILSTLTSAGTPATLAQRPLKKAPGCRGAVASENRICSELGANVIADGGNAADALVATVFCIGVLDCHHSGPGGGGFAIARSADGNYESIDFRESAPAASHEDMFCDNVNASLTGGLAIATPGEMKGLHYIHHKYGSLPWQHLLQPAINFALQGFEISQDFAIAMNESSERSDFLTTDPAWAIDFAPEGRRLQQGEIMTRKRYGKMLQAVAESGPDAFYHGSIAEATIRAVRANNGILDHTDLQMYDIVSRTPITIDYGGYHLYSTGLPASGAVTLGILGILDGYDDADVGDASLRIHHIDEAMRFGYGKRASFGDPDFVNGMSQLEAEMMSPAFAAAIRSRISDTHTLNVSEYDPEGFESLQNHGTSQIVTADASGMAFSVTTSVNLYFGSKVMVPETGLILNNEMNGDFSIPGVSNIFGYRPSPSNYIRPAKRPLSSNSPLIIDFPNGTLFSVLGASGGSRIITTNVQNVLHVLDDGMSIPDALASPRMHDQLLPNQVTFEPLFDDAVVEGMRHKGHNATRGKVGSSGQALRIINGAFEAAGEPRQHDSGGATI